MTTEAPDLLDLLSAVAENPHPLADRDRDAITAAFVAAAEIDHGTVDPNRVRALLSNDHGLTVAPRMLSATYSHLRASGVIAADGWTTNTDVRGGNAGKPLRLYRWVGAA